MLDATLRLFKAVQIKNCETDNVDQDTHAVTIPYGYVLDPRIEPTPELLEVINNRVGVTGEQANAAFHKSWEKIRTADMEQLVLEQVLHYITTYGFSSAGIYDSSTVFIPAAKLELPEVSEDIPLTFIRGLSSDQLLSQIIELGSGVALHERSLNDVMTIVEANGYQPDFLDQIANHELLARLYDHYNMVPEEPVAFLRYLIYRLTDTSLLIKNDELIEQIKTAEPERKQKLDALITQAPENLASIFLRFKPLFLALKAASSNKNFFNRLRKKSVKLHQPLAVDYLNSITEQIKKATLDLTEFRKRLESAPVFRKVRLAHALHFRIHSSNCIVYPVRNGKGWATDFDWPTELHKPTAEALSIVVDSITDALSSQVKGKTVYIPEYINYALPSSEKQFAGPFPFGTYVTTASDTVFGIHWFNVGDRSIDLDLSLLSAKGKVGWDAKYRDESALFSGDITDAPRPLGASELFHVKNGTAPQLVMCNYYNFSAEIPVEAKILVAKEAPSPLTENYMVDVNRIVAKADILVTKKQTILGLVATVGSQTRFYFGNVSLGCGISATPKCYTSQARNFLSDKFANMLDLKRILVAAGAEVTATRPETNYIDLSPENLTKPDLIALFQSRSVETEETAVGNSA